MRHLRGKGFSDDEPFRNRPVEPPLAHEIAPCAGLPRRQQVCRVELLRDPVRLDEPGPATGAPGLLAPPPAVLVTKFDADLAGQAFDRFGEGEVLNVRDELDDVTADPAAVAVVEAVVRVDVERPGFLVMERAQTDQRGAASGEGDVLADDLFDRGALLDGKDVLRPDPSRHPRHLLACCRECMPSRRRSARP